MSQFSNVSWHDWFSIKFLIREKVLAWTQHHMYSQGISTTSHFSSSPHPRCSPLPCSFSSSYFSSKLIDTFWGFSFDEMWASLLRLFFDFSAALHVRGPGSAASQGSVLDSDWAQVQNKSFHKLFILVKQQYCTHSDIYKPAISIHIFLLPSRPLLSLYSILHSVFINWP